ncbi:MAG: homoserine dehydrogenase [Anaerolineae bacterium]|nr:MAG: homoserine dehydrogenase [Anaerolineae bacterium]
MREVGFLLVGVGNVGRRFLEVIARKRDVLEGDLGLRLRFVGAADTSGIAVCSDGLDAGRVVGLKAQGRGVAAYPQWGRPGVSAREMVQTTGADLLLEASPANLQDGQPGLSCIEAALSRGMHVVTANKSPLVLAFPRLLALARRHSRQLCFDATVAGGLPAVNLGQRDLAGATIHRLEGTLNLTANYILTRMARDGLGYDQALAEAQAAGHAEADPSLDVEGWDAAGKLVILAHSVLGHPVTLADVAVEGIAGITAGKLRRAAARGKRVKLVAVAERDGDSYRLSVRPTWLEADHPLAQLGARQMGIVYHTDIMGAISAAIVEETPVPTAAAMLRDVIGIYRTGSA